jgi:hypothetical protein
VSAIWKLRARWSNGAIYRSACSKRPDRARVSQEAN